MVGPRNPRLKVETWGTLYVVEAGIRVGPRNPRLRIETWGTRICGGRNEVPWVGYDFKLKWAARAAASEAMVDWGASRVGS
jgi:hypothetical protein